MLQIDGSELVDSLHMPETPTHIKTEPSLFSVAQYIHLKHLKKEMATEIVVLLWPMIGSFNHDSFYPAVYAIDYCEINNRDNY